MLSMVASEAIDNSNMKYVILCTLESGLHCIITANAIAARLWDANFRMFGFYVYLEIGLG